MMEHASMRTPAQVYTLVLGSILVVAGTIGFFYNATFTSNKAVHDNVLGIFAVNGWHNVMHIATGVVGLLAVGYAARACALGLGLFYVVVAIWGFAVGSGDSILGIVPVNTADNVVHLLVGLAGVAAYISTPLDRPVPAT
jgi:hypothetical protein